MALNRFNAGFNGVVYLDRYTQSDVIKTLWDAWSTQIKYLLQNHCIGCTEQLDNDFCITVESEYNLDHTISIKLEDMNGEAFIVSDCKHTTQSLLFAVISKELLLTMHPVQIFNNVEQQRAFMNLYIRKRIPNLALAQYIKHRRLILSVEAHMFGKIRVDLIFELPDGRRLNPKDNDLILLSLSNNNIQK